MCFCGCVQVSVHDQDSRLLEEELAQIQQAEEEENQFGIGHERHGCVFLIQISLQLNAV